MGIIRKTTSIATFGVVSFRSKKERLRRAEAAHRSATADLAAEQSARAEADDRVASAERRAEQAELLALKEAKLAARRGHKLDQAKDGRGRRARRKASRRAKHAEGTIRSSVSGFLQAAEPVVADTARAARRGGRAARRRADRAARRAEHLAERVQPKVESATAKARERAAELAERARERVDA